MEDLIDYYTQYAKELTRSKDEEKTRAVLIDTSEKLPIGTDDVRNVGYGMLKLIYKEPEIDKFWNRKTCGRKMREVYRGLARIEDSFKVTKTHFETQPVYVWLNEHIDAHFATCFLALVLIRLLENKLGRTFPAGRILDVLRSYNCVHLDRNL